MSEIFAVLTGDIIGSTKLSEPRHAYYSLRKLKEALTENFRNCLEFDLQTYRGDSWQLVLSRPEKAISIALFSRYFLLAEEKIDSRVAIGIGEVDVLDEVSPLDSSGTAFVESGRLLETIMGKRHSNIAITSGVLSESTLKFSNSILGLVEKLIVGLTQRQARISYLTLTGNKTVSEIAIQEGLLSQIVYNSMRRSGIIVIQHAVSAIEDQLVTELFSD